MKITHLKKMMCCLQITALLCTLTACSQAAEKQTETSGQTQQTQVSIQSQPSQPPQSTGETKNPDPSQPEATVSAGGGGILVAYFSATGNTKSVAEIIAKPLSAELYEIVPANPYTSDDLNWSESGSRSNKEHEDPAIRPDIAGEAKDLSSYDTIFIGYPLWWGEAPNIVWNFVESSDLAGKTVIPFCTSSSSGFGASGETLKGFAPDANWLDGKRFQSGADEADVQSWVNGLDINGK